MINDTNILPKFPGPFEHSGPLWALRAPLSTPGPGYFAPLSLALLVTMVRMRNSDFVIILGYSRMTLYITMACRLLLRGCLYDPALPRRDVSQDDFHVRKLTQFILWVLKFMLYSFSLEAWFTYIPVVCLRLYHYTCRQNTDKVEPKSTFPAYRRCNCGTGGNRQTNVHIINLRFKAAYQLPLACIIAGTSQAYTVCEPCALL
jgi:hypothetical protein